MSIQRRALLITSAFALAAAAAACDAAPPTEPAGGDLISAAAVLASDGATVERGEYPAPFPPRAPLMAVPPCLDLEEGLRISGTWWIRYQVVRTPSGREHWTEHLDYSDVALTSGELTWLAAPGASEIIHWIGDANGRRNIIHEFHARYLSQDGLPDLQVSHSVHLVVGPDGITRRAENIFFNARCVGVG